MKTAEAKTTSANHQPLTRQLFFQKEGGESAFFSDRDIAVQTKPFFDTVEEPVDTGIDSLIAKDTDHSQDGAALAEEAHTNSAETIAVQTKCAECREEEQKVQKKEVEEDEGQIGQEPEIQEKPIFESEAEISEEPVQTKPSTGGLTVGQPGDKYEIEADAMADQVVNTKCEENSSTFTEGLADKPASIKISADKEEEQEEALESEPSIQEKPILSEASEKQVQTKPEAENFFNDQSSDATSTTESNAPGIITTLSAPVLQPKCEACEREEQEEKEEQGPPGLQKMTTVGDDESNKVKDDEFMSGRSWEEAQADKEILFKLEPSVQLSGSSGATDETSVRNRIEQVARKELGKVEAKRADATGRRVGFERLLEYFHLAAPDEWPDEVIEYAKYGKKHFPHWCGIFSVFVIKKAGIDIGNWKKGTGVSQFNTLKQTDSPQKGDVGYIHEPWRHHSIIIEVNGDTVKSIDGNSGPVSGVLERTRPISEYSGFFTAFTGSEKYIQKKEEELSSQTTDTSLQDKLNATAGKGSSLNPDMQSQMESGFGADFSDVNIHTDSEAVEMNKGLHSQAFTHGSDIYFNEGKYNPETSSGKHLLAHELTHTVQQGASGNVQAKKNNNVPDIQCLLPVAGPVGWYVSTKIIQWGIGKLREKPEEAISMAKVLRKVLLSIPVDIRGMSYFNPPSVIAEHIKAHAIIADFLREIKGIFGFTDKDINEYAKGPKINLRYGNLGNMPGVRVRWNTNSSTYQMGPYQMALSHPLFDFSESPDILGLEARIKDSKIAGKVGVANSLQLLGHILKASWNDSPSSFQFNFELLEKAILGEEASDTYPLVSYGILNNGYIILMYLGLIDIGNYHLIAAFLHLNDRADKAEWKGELDLDVMGMQPFTLDIDRTPKGLLSGSNEEKKILLDKSFAKKGTDTDEEKGFEFTSNITASYLNKVLTIQGAASYNSKRAKGNLFLMVTDYSTAKAHAIQFLPEEIAAKAEADEPPPNPSERLAFMGSGNLSFTLFDGNKETRKLKLGKSRKFIGEEPEVQTNKALQADASFVVEPEGYITIAGQVKPKQEEFDLFDKKKYEKEIELLEVPIAKIPGPLTSRADFNFEVNLKFGASIGPLTLSEIKAEGLYSNRPDTLTELELSGLIKLPGELFVNLSFCIEVEGSILGIFEIELIEACIEAGVGLVGAVQARPTIQMVLPTKATINTPPEYFIRGNFHFDAGGKLFLQLGDSLKINLTEKDTDTPSNWKYKNSREVAKKEFGGRDVEIPMDHTLGGKEIPRVSFRQFAKENLKRFLSKLITSDRPRRRENVDKYFEPGKTSEVKSETSRGEEKFGAGGFEEGREEKGKLEEGTTPSTTEESKANYVFSEKFTMWGTSHELHLILKQNERGDKLAIETMLMMESELEELSEKIEEENKEVETSDDSVKDLQKADLVRIEGQANQIKKEAKELGVDNELSNKAKFPGLKETTFSIQNYGNRYKKSDLGIEDKTAEPDCDKPKDVHPGDEIFFPNYTAGENIGFVVEIVSYPSIDKKESFWHIRFKPKSGRKKTSVAPPAYDKDCKPTYILPKSNKGCESIHIEHAEKDVPARVVNTVHFTKRSKANLVKAYPLCWGTELKPKGEIVGMDRISPKKQSKWHRAHLIHAKMGGKGAYWNLAPVPQQVNNSKMPTQYESKLIKLVLDGFKNGKQYWFKAEVVYHQNSDNPVVGHYDDFVKEIRIYYGEAVDLGNGNWEFKDNGKLKTSIAIGNKPSSSDLAPGRVKG